MELKSKLDWTAILVPTTVTIIGFSVQWGTLAAKVQAQDDKLRDIAPLAQKVPVLMSKVESIDQRTQDIYDFLLRNNRSALLRKLP